MNSNTILTSELLDILFYNRNKNYGAYTLRKFYPERVKMSLCIMIVLSALFSAFTFLPNKKGKADEWIKEGEIFMATAMDLPKESEKPKERETQPGRKAPAQQITRNFEVVKEKEHSTVFDDFEDITPGSATDTGNFIPGPQEPFTGGGPDFYSIPPIPPPVPDTGPIENPDIPPTFPGGNEALIHFLEKNLQAPDELSEAVLVKVKFVVNNEGYLESFDILEDGGEEFNKEVIRVLKKMPQWNPGKKGGLNIKAYCYLPVKFESRY